MITLNNPYLYLKGTCNVNVSDINTGDVVFASSKVQTNNFTTDVDMGAIRAGLGNTIAIQLPSDATVNLELTTADFSMQTRAMQLGSNLSYNAVVPRCATVTASGTTIQVDGAEPVANYGFDKAYCYVNYAGSTNAGAAYPMQDDGTVEGFVAENGKTYNVIYYERQANAQALGVSGNFAPGIYHVSAQMAVFSTEGSNAGNRGTQVGWAYYIIPRMQFAGNAETSGSQTDAATSTLSGTALSYEAAAQEGVCTDCSFPMLAYMIYVPLSSAGNGLTGLVVIGGGVTVAAGGTAVLPVKYVMNNKNLVQPNYAKLDYEVASSSIATVANGVVTGVAAGSTTVTITSQDDESISTVCSVTVTSA